MDAIFHCDEDVDWSEIRPQEAEKIAIPLTQMYCEKIAPRQEYVAVEALCDNLAFTDIGLTLTGTVDRVRKTDQGLGIADLKTGKSAVAADGTVKTQGHALQMGVYEILTQAALGIPMDAPAQIIGLQTGKTDRGRRVGCGEIPCAREALLDSAEREAGYLRMAARLLHSATFYGNPRSGLCSEKYCPAYKICRWRK